MYWYVVLDGNILPTPYLTMREALDEIKRLKERLCACVCDVVLK